MTDEKTLIETINRIAPGHYVERDGGYWYCIVPGHGSRSGEDFRRKVDALRFICWLAGEAMPEGWKITPAGNLGRVHYDIAIPNEPTATLWIRTVRALFPARAAEIEAPAAIQRVYSVEMMVCATAYIKASSPAEALAKARALDGSCPAILDSGGDVPVSGLQLTDPKLPDVSLSPMMTIHSTWNDAVPEVAE